MQTFDWKHTIRINLLVLKFAGLWPADTGGYKCDQYTLYAILLNIIVNSNNVFQTAYIYYIYNDLQALTSMFFLLLTTWLATVKTVFFASSSRTIQRLVQDLDCEEFQPKNDKQNIRAQQTLWTWKIMYISFYFAVGASVTFLCFYPVMDGSFKEFRLPVFSWYPYDTNKSPNYELTYVYQGVIMAVSAFTNLNMDTLIAALMVYVVCQCEILCDNFQNTEDDPNISYNTKLVGHVIHYKKIVRYVPDILGGVLALIRIFLVLDLLKVAIIFLMVLFWGSFLLLLWLWHWLCFS